MIFKISILSLDKLSFFVDVSVFFLYDNSVMEKFRAKNMIEFLRDLRNNRRLQVAALVSLPLFALFCLFVMEYMNFNGWLEDLLHFLQRHPLSALFSSLAILVIFGFLLLLCKKAVIAAGILGAISLVFAYVNYMKVLANGDHFFPRDIAMIGNAGELTYFIAGASAPRWYFLGIAVITLWVVALWFFKAELPLGWKVRLPSAAVILLAVLLLFGAPRRAERVLGVFDMSFFDAALQSSNYQANGFLGAFLINTMSMRVERPAGYSEAAIRDLLDGFEATPQTGEDFDVIVVLSESFFDVRILDAAFSENPLPNFDRVRESDRAVSGMIYTTAVGGGTIRPEFEILTGLTTDFLPSGAIPYEMLRRPMPTHVSNYRDAGYVTIALHPYNERFYSRNTAYPLLGFDEFWGRTALEEQFPLEYRGLFISDESMLEPIKYFLNVTDDPTFMFVITMQNHQPFPRLSPEEIEIQVTSNSLSPEVLDNVTSFTRGLHDSDRFLGTLVDYIDTRERPTVLLFWGDHLPNLGANHAAFAESGLIDPDNMFTTEVRHVLFSTPFLIYANRDLDRGVFDSHMDNRISTYYLLSALAVMTDFHRTPYMNLLLDHHSRVPVYNGRLIMEDTPEILSLMHTLRLMTYDRLVGHLYAGSR